MEPEDQEQEIELQQEPVKIYTSGGAVNSVNGQTGDVVLTTSDLQNTSDYQTGTEVSDAISTAVAGKQDVLTAGDNITISDDVISAIDTTITTLTADDYNYDSNNDGTNDKIAVWKLPVGAYTWDNTTTRSETVFCTNDPVQYFNNILKSNTACIVIGMGEFSTRHRVQCFMEGNNPYTQVGGYTTLIPYDVIISGTQIGKGNFDIEYVALSVGDVVDNLTSTSTIAPLSANQGKALKDTIDNLPTVNDATLTITQNGTSKGIFTANDADDTTIEVTDTTYSNFVGTDGNTGGTAGLVPAPATTDVGKFLKADGTWDTAGGGGGPTVVQTTGTSTTDVMSQNATTSMVFADPSTVKKIQIGSSASSTGTDTITIGASSASSSWKGIALGSGAKANADNAISIGSAQIVSAAANGGIAIGSNVSVIAKGAVAIGAASSASTQGEFNIGANSAYGYSGSTYRLLTGLYDPQSAHDAATKGYVDSIVVNYATLTAAGAPTTSTAAVSVGQLYYDSTNDDYYYCSAIDTTDPQNPSYTWSALSTGGGGGGPTVVQTTGTSTTDVMSQNATTSMVFADPSTAQNISIGNTNAGSSAVSIGRSAYGAGNYSVSLGYQSNTYNGSGAVAVGQGARARNTNAIAIGYTANQGLDGGANSVAIGSSAKANTSGSVSIGYNAAVLGNDNVALGSSAQTSGSVLNATALGASSVAGHRGSVALGSSAQTTSKGQIMVGTENTYDGYSSTNYRLVSGVYDGQGAHDAVTVGQVNATIDAINTALSTNIPHIGA